MKCSKLGGNSGDRYRKFIGCLSVSKEPLPDKPKNKKSRAKTQRRPPLIIGGKCKKDNYAV
jgi:hypothetical protein